MFLKQFGVLDHSPIERLKNHPTLFQSVGEKFLLDQFVSSKDEPGSHLIKAPRLFPNILKFFPIRFAANLIRGEIE